jgi:hypothetical protein
VSDTQKACCLARLCAASTRCRRCCAAYAGVKALLVWGQGRGGGGGRCAEVTANHGGF